MRLVLRYNIVLTGGSMNYRITLIKGDGIGPELAEVAKKCVEATGINVSWEEVEAGVDVMAKEGTPLPDRTIESVKKNNWPSRLL